MNIKKLILTAAATAFLIPLTCSAVKGQSVSKAKKVPKVYSENYNYQNVKSKPSEINRKAWIVYSDRARNTTSLAPGGTVVHKEMEFMEPMLVTGSKGDYLQLVKYSEGMLKNEKIADRKNAEYYGWIHKDKLLLYNSSVTEIRNGIKLKSTLALTDTTSILHPAGFVKEDMVKFYKHPSLDLEAGAVPLNTIVYVMKLADNNTRALVSYKSALQPGTAANTVCGWVDASMVVPMGQRLTMNPSLKMVPTKDAVILIDKNAPGQGMVKAYNSPFGFTPLVYADKNNNGLSFRTLDANPVLDKNDNRVFNVDGELISYNKHLEMKHNLSQLNVIFAFDMTLNVVKQMPVLYNAVQNIKPVFDSAPDLFNYSYGAVFGDFAIPLNSDYQAFSDQVIAAASDIAEYEKIYKTQWSLEHALRLAAVRPYATNIIVHIGEEASAGEKPEQYIVDGFIRNNCRLLSFQVYSGGKDSYNNFVLQATSIIEQYANSIQASKRKLVIYPEQLRNENLFREINRNSYSLDFPKRSNTQGVVLFPEKKQTLLAKDLITAVDSISREVEKDNFMLIESLERAFAQIGNHRDKFDAGFVSRFDIDPNRKVEREFKNVFNDMSPDWVAVTDKINVKVDSAVVANMSLLLTENELEELKQFMEKISAMQLDMKTDPQKEQKKIKKIEKVRKEIKYIPSDSQLGSKDYVTDQESAKTDIYASTGLVRKYLKRTYLKELDNCIFEGKAKHLTLAAAQEYITSAPTVTPILNRVRIKDLTNRYTVTNAELDAILIYFSQQKQSLEKLVKLADEVNIPQGEKYYMLEAQALP